MKKSIKYLILLLLVGFINKVFSQSLVNNGGVIFIENGAKLLVKGDFVNNITSQTINNGHLVLTGKVTNNEKMIDPFQGLWELASIEAQIVNGLSPLWVNDIKFNSKNITTQNTIWINGLASFQKGIIKVNTSASPIIFSKDAQIDNLFLPTDASHIIGFVVKEGLGTFDFPIGGNGKYQPVTVNLADNSDGLQVSYAAGGNAGIGSFVTTGTDPTPLIGYNTSEYWDIGPVTGGTATGTVKLYWDSQNETLTGGYSTRKVAHKVGTNWQNEGTFATGSDASGSVTSNPAYRPRPLT